MTTASAPTAATARPATRRIWRAGLSAALLAAAVNTLVRLLGELTPAGWEVTQAGQTQQVLVFLPAVASVLGLLAGTLALWVLARFSWGVTVWTVLAVLVGLGSIPSPVAAAEDGWTGALLALMHAVCLAVALVVLRPAGRRTA